MSKSPNNEMESSSKAAFVCQRCLQPLTLDPSFYALNEHALAEMRLTAENEPDFEPDNSVVNVDLVVNEPDFTLVDNNQDHQANATASGLGSKLKVCHTGCGGYTFYC